MDMECIDLFFLQNNKIKLTESFERKRALAEGTFELASYKSKMDVRVIIIKFFQLK